MKTLIFAIVLAASSLFSGTALAHRVCWMADHPEVGYGEHGGVMFSLHKDSCDADYIDTYFICSSGATSSFCINDPKHLLKSAEAMTRMSRNLLTALQLKTDVSVDTEPCIDPNKVCAKRVYFKP